MECMRQYISELLDFIADMHTLTKLKVSPILPTQAPPCCSSVGFTFCPIWSSEPYEGLLSAATRGHLRGEPESGPGTGCGDGDQQRQSPRQQSGGPLPPLALSSTLDNATRVKTNLRSQMLHIVVYLTNQHVYFFILSLSAEVVNLFFSQIIHRVSQKKKLQHIKAIILKTTRCSSKELNRIGIEYNEFILELIILLLNMCTTCQHVLLVC